MEIETAIMHHYNEAEDLIFLNQKVMRLATMPEFEEALIKIFESFLRFSQKRDYHLEDSSVFDKIQEEDFIQQSQEDAKRIFSYRKEEAKNRNILFLACKIYHNEIEYYAFYEFHLRSAFISQDDQIEKELILPDRFASSKFAVFLDLFNYEGSVKVNEKDYAWFQESYQIDLVPNAKEAYQMLDRWTQEIASNRGGSPLEQSLENKKTLSHLSESFDVIASADFGEEVLGGLDEKEQALLSERFEIENFNEELDLSALRKARVSNKLHLITDKGIEVIIPLKDLVLDQVLEIDDSLHESKIILKNVGEIISK